MFAPRFFNLAAALCAAALAAAGQAHAAAKDASVQKLANFAVLKHFAAPGKATALRRYLSSISTAYRAAGYPSLGAALPQSKAIIRLFDDKPGETSRRDLAAARAALRTFRTALKRDHKIALPAMAGERLPNYYGLAATFLLRAGKVLDKVAQGKGTAHLVDMKPLPSWIVNQGDGDFAIGNAGSSITFSSGVSGTLGMSSITYTNTGGTSVVGGTLTLSGSLSNSLIFLSLGSTLTLASDGDSRWVAFPPDVEIPDDWSGLAPDTFGVAVTDGEQIYPIGTRIVIAPISLPLPDGATELTSPTTLRRDFSSSALSFATPTPSPAPAE